MIFFDPTYLLIIIVLICCQFDINKSLVTVLSHTNVSFVQQQHHKSHNHKLVDESNILLRNVRFGHFDNVLSLLKNATFSKYHVNALEQRDITGHTSLQVAIKFHHVKIAKLLINYGADIFSKIIATNETTLMLASHIGSLSLVELLLSKGMYIDELDVDGISALMYAVNMRHYKVVQLLVNQGCNVNIQDVDGYSSLMIAITKSDVKLVSYLLERGSNVELQEIYGLMSPLILSSAYGCLECSKLLLQYGADVNATCIENLNNSTALLWSTRNGDYHLCDLLLSHGANVNAIESLDGIFHTPLSIAFEQANDDLFRLFIRYGASYQDRVTIQHRWNISETLTYCLPIDLDRILEYDSFLNVLLLKELLNEYKLSTNILCSIPNSMSFLELRHSRRAVKGYLNAYFHNEHSICYRSKAANDATIEPYLPIPYLYNKSENVSLHLYTPKHEVFGIEYILFNLDIIFEYSQINAHVFKTSGFYPEDVFKRIVYIPTLIPYIYANKQQSIDVDKEVNKRNLDLITTFRDKYFKTNRRLQFLEYLRSRNISVTNFSNINGKNYVEILEEFAKLYSKSKILLILRQEETWGMVFEEIRVLPALMNGMIVISETAPLYEKLPYHEYIIWGELGELEDIIHGVLKNYRYYFEKIHGKYSKLQLIIEEMKMMARSNLKEALDYAFATQAADG